MVTFRLFTNYRRLMVRKKTPTISIELPPFTRTIIADGSVRPPVQESMRYTTIPPLSSEDQVAGM